MLTQNNICLFMITKNDAKCVLNSLNSLKSIVDCVQIVDYNSIDDTREIITKWGQDTNIPTNIILQTNFTNFTDSFNRCGTAAEQNYPDVDYFLVSWPNYIWTKLDTFDKHLTDDRYCVRYISSVSVYVTVLYSTKFKWIAHPLFGGCMDNDLAKKTTKLDTLQINH